MFRTVTGILWLGFYLRTCVAAWNGFIAPSVGAAADASTFQMIAVLHSYNLDVDKSGMDSASIYYPFVIGWIYPYVLGAFYAFTTPSLFLGSFLSVVMWTASAFILVRTMRLLSFDKTSQFTVMLIYALLPSSILHTCITLREPYQLFFVNLAVYAALKIYMNKSIVCWPVLFCAAIGMGTLHHALCVFGAYLVVAALLMFSLRYRQSGSKISVLRLTFVVPLVVCIVIYGISYFQLYSYGNSGGDWPTKIEGFQQGMIGLGARSNYKSSVDIDSGIALLYYVPVNLFQYFFEPMPWRISNSFDVIVMLENILRAWLLLKVWKRLRSVSVQGKSPVLFVFISYLILEIIWSLGTVSWGNAVRHHIPSVGLLLVVAFVRMRAPQSRNGEYAK
jgi:hypothetical protein